LNPTVWAVALLIAAMLLCFLEIFIPSMGVITFFAVCCAAGSCWAAFLKGGGIGTLFIVLNAASMAAGYLLGFKFLPHSPLALRNSQVEHAKTVPSFDPEKVMNAAGTAFTDLRPGGTALINDRKIDVVAHGGYIEQGTKIRVIKVEGTKVVVAADTV
jgi:membrane-bound serine protease (ClpP class)